MTTLAEACEALAKHTFGSNIAVTFSSEEAVEIYWYGVTRLDCTPAQAAKAIPLLRQLENLGMKDC